MARLVLITALAWAGCSPRADCDATTWYADRDGDGFGSVVESVSACDAPRGFVVVGGDCDDASEQTHPDAAERCDEEDNDCDGAVDDDLVLVWYADGDRDGFGDLASVHEGCDPPPDYVADGTDCHDADPSVYPFAPEVCDGQDNDCDFIDDEDAVNALTFYPDGDGDGWGDAGGALVACNAPDEGYVALSGDCNDDEHHINPGAQEVCDGDDNDCDQLIDDEDLSVNADLVAWHDDDGDGYGDPTRPEVVCALHDDLVDNALDCDDADIGLSPEKLWFRDLDGDGHGDADAWTTTCERPDGYTDSFDDCFDREAGIFPGSPEVCNRMDDDCDGLVDDEDPSVDLAAGVVLYEDLDGDGWGSAVSETRCDVAVGWSERTGDCDDADPLLTVASTWWPDLDEDGFGAGIEDLTVSCTAPAAGYAPVSAGEDCDDTRDWQSPGTPELCGNSFDEDCDGLVATCHDAMLLGDIGVLEADVAILGPRARDRLGSSVGTAHLNGDGLPELMIGAEGDGASDDGAVLVFTSPPEMGNEASVVLIGSEGEKLGTSVAGIPDFTGDGLDELILGARRGDLGGDNAGQVYFVDSQSISLGSGNIPVSSVATVTLIGEFSDDRAGHTVSYGGDVDGNGQPDVLIGADRASVTATESGAVYLLNSSIPAGLRALSVYADARWLGSRQGAEAGAALSGIGDFNGDGFDDFAVGAPRYESDDVREPGAAYIVLGRPMSGDFVFRTDADVMLDGDSDNWKLGGAVGGRGDIDGDGYMDAAFGARFADVDEEDGGAAYVVRGGLVDIGEAFIGTVSTLTVYGDTASVNLGSAVSIEGDVDGDGLDDLLIGGDLTDHAWLAMSAKTGLVEASSVDVRWTGEVTSSMGNVVHLVDHDGDHHADPLIAAWTSNSASSSAGAVYLFFGTAAAY